MSSIRPLRTLIIDDEPLAREGIRLLIGSDADIQIVGEAEDGQSAIDAILEHRPDLVFLDVQMPEKSGLDALREVPSERLPLVVFVTAFDRYAIDAFEAHALDYLLKPVVAERFSRTLARVKSRFRERELSEVTKRLMALMHGQETLSGPPQRFAERIPVPFGGKVQLVPVSAIDWIEAEDDYVRLHVGKTTHLLRKTLTAFESELNPEHFARIHRSRIVNLSRIKELRPHGQGEYTIVLVDGTSLKLSRTYRERIAKLLP